MRRAFAVSPLTGYATPHVPGWRKPGRPVTRSCPGQGTARSKKYRATRNPQISGHLRGLLRSNWQQDCQNLRAFLTNPGKKPTKTNPENADGGRGRTRTGTPVSQKQILSLLCLPFHHAARAQGFIAPLARAPKAKPAGAQSFSAWPQTLSQSAPPRSVTRPSRS